MDRTNLARKFSQPLIAARPQKFGVHNLINSHEEALFGYGELGLFTLMWRHYDFEAGRVDRCSTCFGGVKSRQANAFKQPTDSECPDCFGTTYEGGFRAQIIRPMLMSDRSDNTVEGRAGAMTVDSIQFETTTDFTFTLGDYVFRADNTRYQCEQKAEVVIRPGFAIPSGADAMGGTTIANREVETSVAFKIPPLDPALLATMLSDDITLDPDLSAFETIRDGGYLLQDESR